MSRAEDIEHVLKHPEVFASGFEPIFKPAWLGHNPLGDSLITKDGPAHAKLRALVSKAFTPRALARLEPRIRAVCIEVAEHLAQVREGDFIDELCARLPGLVIAELVGLDRRLVSELKRWVGHLATVSPVYPGDEAAAAIRATIREMEEELGAIVAARRLARRDDIVSDLIAAEVDGHALSDEEIISFLFLMLAAGFETTMHFFSGALLDFDQRPDAFTRLREDRERIPTYVEELLRKEPPVHSVFRLTAVDTELCGVQLPRGTLVMILLASGNYDTARLAETGSLDAKRAGHAGFAFGHGIHYCLGAFLARLEARVMLEELATRFVGFEKLPGEIEWNLAFHVRGPVALPFRAIPAPGADEGGGYRHAVGA
ncbi:MAG TPA: cytochrome P450 [Kofleriaceae bacterium]|nr:cytochrome P450 [Kofleriaceae bacterium]